MSPSLRSIACLTLAVVLAGGLAAAQTTPAPQDAAAKPLPAIVSGAAQPAPAAKPAPASPDAPKDSAAPAAPVAPRPAPTPAHRSRYDVAVLEALDKVTAENLKFEAPVGRPIRYKSLIFTVKACERSTSDEPIDDSIAYLTIDSQPRPEPGKPAMAPRQAFKGWMYASSPGLNPLQHPVYDAWLITCRATAPAIAPAPPVAKAAPPAAAPDAAPAPKPPAPKPAPPTPGPPAEAPPT